MRNASPSEKDDGSMIQYWEDKTHISLAGYRWQCPKCKKWFKREQLDGAHVVNSFYKKNYPQYITPLCYSCNRKRDDKGFWVLKRYVVPTP
jgi:hypothetical protein